MRALPLPARRLLLIAATGALLATAVPSASAATSYVASFGSHGASRWTVGASVYVNLKAMSAGVWKQQIWSGTCAAPAARLSVLPSLVVPSSHVLAKATTFRTALPTGGGLVLRLLFGTTVICGAYTKPVVVPPPPPPATGALRGVDLVGMEYGWNGINPGVGPEPDTNYPVIDTRLIDYLGSKHVRILMFTFSWEGMQSIVNGSIPASQTGNYKAYFDNYKRIVDYATAHGMVVVVAPWQAGVDGGIAGPAYRGNLVGSAQVPVSAFTDFWSKMATIFKDNPNVWYRLITEPHDMSTMQWWTTAQAALNAIRATGSTQKVLVPGNDYSAASQWTDNWYDTAEPQRSNAFGYLNASGPGQPLHDSANNFLVEVHTYLDPDEGGVTKEITSVTAASDHLKVAVDEARVQGYKLFLGEIGMYAAWRTNDNHPASDAWRNFVNYANANSDILQGWTWWAAGTPGWWDDPDSEDGGHYAVTPTNGNTYTGDTVNMDMIENDF